jgi:hypothetical protein
LNDLVVNDLDRRPNPIPVLPQWIFRHALFVLGRQLLGNRLPIKEVRVPGLGIGRETTAKIKARWLFAHEM